MKIAQITQQEYHVHNWKRLDWKPNQWIIGF